ncbi:hypothetical protein H9P43_001031 [Blastocladiella emersonii ATCC 22665]|nr:hypothetical protein H9P43_001031 [Blastocladiella emersonii ATCC 22665]
MTSMKDAMKRLTVIHAACVPQEQTEKPDADEFTRVKKQIAANVKIVREMVKQRNDILKADKTSKKGVGSGTETAEMSFKIRSQLKAIKEDITVLDGIVKKAEKKIKGKNKPDLQEILDSRKEIVQLCNQHLEECENLDRARFNDKLAGDRANLFVSSGIGGATSPSSALKFNKFAAGASSVSPGMAPPGPGGASSGSQELPDIEVAEDLALIRQRNMDIDQELDEISAGVQVIKQIAIQMGDELDKQNEMLDTIDAKVDKANEHVQNVNLKMKEALDGVMKGDKFLVNCVLLCILLALIAYITSQLV